jgi:UDP-N-acetylmuramoyl-tripeptide--D-alanyl-D-alanine ligase
MSIEELYQYFCKFPAVSTDTRKSVRDTIFFALHGDKFDGNAYVVNALRDGAAYAVADAGSLAGDQRIIIVDNTLIALQNLAAYHRSQLNANIIAITGSNGKTTTKELITRVLSCKYSVCSTQGNLNNHIGVPLTILTLTSKNQFGVIEIGANHFGEIARLCRITRPGFGLITNIGRAHLEGFGSIEGVIKAKKELYEYLQEINGSVFVNCGDQVLINMLSGFRGEIIKYGNCEGSIFSGAVIKSYPFLSLKASDGNQADRPFIIKTRMPGDFNTDNILAALGVGSYFGVEIKKMVKAIADYIPDNLRSQVMKTEYNTLFIDAYNANPTSMLAAIRNFQKFPGKNKMLIIGEMAELGDASEQEHRSLLSFLEKLDIKKILLVGDSFYRLSIPTGFTCFGNVQELSEWLGLNPVRNTNILLKGSRIAGLEKLIPYL